jgi:GNAT superfamily N-acetyltransferase
MEPVGDPQTDLEVRQIDEDAAATFAKIVKGGFEWPDPVEPLVACLVGRPNWLHYIAYDGDAPAATAALFVHGEFGWLDFAATLPDYRGRGGQNALIARRIQDATARGVQRLIVETAEGKPDKPSPSYRNIVRFGFETAYVRPNFLWTKQGRQHPLSHGRHCDSTVGAGRHSGGLRATGQNEGDAAVHGTYVALAGELEGLVGGGRSRSSRHVFPLNRWRPWARI